MNQSFNNQFHTQRLRESIDETSATPAEGGYLTKPGAKKNSPKPTSGYKDVKGFRPGHSKLKIVEPKDLWNLNETGEKPEPSKEMDYPSGEKVEVGQKIRIDNEQIVNGYGVITGFAQDADDNDVILVTVERDNDSSIPRENFPVQLSDIEKMEDDKSMKDEKPAQKETPPGLYPLQEGIKTEIARRNKPQQFQEATKMINKKLKEINSILEYAEQLKGELDESSRPNHLMEKMKKGMVSAYNKMRKL
jgi:hypothetical protein